MLTRFVVPWRAALVTSVVLLTAPWVFANPPETVLVRRGNVAVTQADYDAEIEKLPSHLRANFASYERKVLEMLDRLLVARELGTQARARGLVDASQLAQRTPLEADSILAAALSLIHI